MNRQLILGIALLVVFSLPTVHAQFGSWELVKEYPAIQWNTIGLPPLRFALIACVLVTAIGGVLSNPLFQWANSAVAGTPLLQQAIALSGDKFLG